MSAATIGFGKPDISGQAGKGLKAVENLFSPEFRNRLDGIISFEGLSVEIMERIVDKFMAEMEEQLKEKRVKIELTDAARSWLAQKGYDPAFGARPLGRLIQTEIKDRLADEILFGRLRKGGRVVVDRNEAAGDGQDAPIQAPLIFEISELSPPS